ncbi:unannotated protein [freshwater metagenome]|uniref:Unannotated protein n=1 Tax=freshwater metagenome TaxID=449393 RepID=A0A6J7VNW8_9ZZZZ
MKKSFRAISANSSISPSTKPREERTGNWSSAKIFRTALTQRDPSFVPSCGTPIASATRSIFAGTIFASRVSVSTSTSPIVKPCGTCLSPPIAWPKECSAVQSEIFIVSPAIMLPAAIPARADLSVPSLKAATRAGVIIRTAS